MTLTEPVQMRAVIVTPRALHTYYRLTHRHRDAETTAASRIGRQRISKCFGTGQSQGDNCVGTRGDGPAIANEHGGEVGCATCLV